jgi:hypothetical protein
MNHVRELQRDGPGCGTIALPSFPVRDSHNTTHDSQRRMAGSTDTSLLDILEAHGQTFLNSFKPHKAEKNKRKRTAGDTAEAHRSPKLVRIEPDRSSSVDDHSDSGEKWTGFGSDAQVDHEYESQSFAEDAGSLEGVLAQL